MTHWFSLGLKHCLLLYHGIQQWQWCCSVYLDVMTSGPPAFHYPEQTPVNNIRLWNDQQHSRSPALLYILTYCPVLPFAFTQLSVRHTVIEDMSIWRYPADAQTNRSLLQHLHAWRTSTWHCRKNTHSWKLNTPRNIFVLCLIFVSSSTWQLLAIEKEMNECMLRKNTT